MSLIPQSEILHPLPERLLSLGDLVGLAFRRFRQNWRLYFRALLWPAIFASIASHVGYYAFIGWLQIAANSLLAWTPFIMHMTVVMCCVIIWFLSVIQMCLRCSAISRVELGLNGSYKEAYVYLKKRWNLIFFAYNLAIIPPLVVVAIWAGIGLICTLFVSAVPPSLRILISSLLFGVIGFMLTVTLTVSSLYSSLLLAVATLEPLTFRESFVRAWFFLSQRTLRGGSFFCLITIALSLVGLTVDLPVELAYALLEYGHKQKIMVAADVPVLLHVADVSMDCLLNIVYLSILFTGFALFYRDLSLRLEGTDILRRIDKFKNADASIDESLKS